MSAAATTARRSWSGSSCSQGTRPNLASTTAAADWNPSEDGSSNDERISSPPPPILETVKRQTMIAFPQTPYRPVPDHIPRPPYADTGRVPWGSGDRIYVHDAQSADKMRAAARLARRVLDLACQLAQPGRTTDEIDRIVHQSLIDAGAYPSPLNYAGFPKSLCSSINEVICHGIPDTRPLQFGDIVSFDVSCFYNGVHGDNCATVIVGDEEDKTKANHDDAPADWRGVPFRTQFATEQDEAHFVEARRLVQATLDSLYAGIHVCRPGGCLSDIGNAIQEVVDAHGYSSVERYRGHGICHEFHCAPFVKHYANQDKLELVPGMVFTIEPMVTQGSPDCHEWDDNWTVTTVDRSLAAQFEHTVLITESGVEILTLPE